jgi:Tol biopolymer transport system component
VGYGTHIINVDGSSDTCLAKGAYPQWLDERRIVYVGLYAHIYTLDLETGVEERIFERLPEWVGDSVRELDVDRTGTRLLFSAFNPGEHANVFQLELGTYQLTQLTTTGGDQPSWSPDGTEIVYTNTQVGRIWIMSADGSNKRPLFKE